jgi:hypothetical protein
VGVDEADVDAWAGEGNRAAGAAEMGVEVECAGTGGAFDRPTDVDPAELLSHRSRIDHPGAAIVLVHLEGEDAVVGKREAFQPRAFDVGAASRFSVAAAVAVAGEEERPRREWNRARSGAGITTLSFEFERSFVDARFIGPLRAATPEPKIFFTTGTVEKQIDPTEPA